MKITGFTIVRNALKYDYPVVEAITSILPICDDFVVAVGDSEDETLQVIKNICPEKIRIIMTEWDDSLRKGGVVLAKETDKAFQSIADDTDWCFYIQADEVIHEKYLPIIRESMEEHLNNNNVDGLLFKYLHFYGSYDYVGESYRWYRNEIRIVRNNKSIYSYRDAQGFRKGDNQRLNVIDTGAFVYHYGWVKMPKAMQQKQLDFNKLWHDDQWIERNIPNTELFDYSNIDSLVLFSETHPEVMKTRIKKLNWKFDYDISLNRLKFKDKVKRFCEKIGLDFGQYKNYNLINKKKGAL